MDGALTRSDETRATSSSMGGLGVEVGVESKMSDWPLISKCEADEFDSRTSWPGKEVTDV